MFKTSLSVCFLVLLVKFNIVKHFSSLKLYIYIYIYKKKKKQEKRKERFSFLPTLKFFGMLV